MKKKLMMVVVFVIVVSFMASCAAPAAPTTAPTVPAAAPATEAPATSAPAAVAPTVTQAPAAVSGGGTKIVFWSHDFPPRQKLDQQYMDKFKQDNPGVDIEYDIGPGDDVQYLTKLATAMAGGQGPDCFNLLNFSAGQFMAQNAVVPLDLSIFGYNSLQDVQNAYVEGTLGGLIKDGKLYAMPSEVSTYSMFVNKPMFTNAGLDVDKDMPTTWEDMVTLGKKLTKYDGNKLIMRMFEFTYGQADDGTSPVLPLAGMAYQLGGTIFNADETESLVNSPTWVKSLQYMQDWSQKENLGDPALTVATLGFMDGSVGMFLGGSWYGPYLKDQKSPTADIYVVKPFPRWKDAVNNTGSFLYAYGEFVNASSSPEKQKLCMMLIKELSSHPAEYLTQTGLLQPTIALTSTDAFKNVPFLDVFVNDMKGTPYWPTHPKSFEIADSLGRAIQRTTLNKMPAQESLDTAKQEIDALLKQ
jgi:multiple sugar transport system substrate-binding protein